MDGVELAAGGAEAAADALIGVHIGRAAGEAPGRLDLDLFLRQGAVGIHEGGAAVDAGPVRRFLPAGVVVGGIGQVVLVQRDVLPAVSADGHGRLGPHMAMEALRRLMACGDGVDHKPRTCVHVAADKDVLIRRLVGEFVRNGVVAVPELHLGVLQQVAPFDALADGEDDLVRGDLHRVVLVVHGGEPLGLRVDGPQAFFQYDAGDLAVFVDLDLLGAPGGVDLDPGLLGLADFEAAGGHGLPVLQTEHPDGAGAQPMGVSGAVDGHVAAADHDHVAGEGLPFLEGAAQIADGDVRSHGVVAGHPGPPAALAADGDVERLVALLLQLGDGHILADLHAAPDLRAELPDHVDLSVDDVLFQLVAGDAVGHHAAGAGILFKHSGTVAHNGQVVGRAEAGGACADDGDFLVKAAVDRGDDFLGDIAAALLPLQIRHEFFDGVDRDRLVDGASGAGVLAALVADPAADGGEGVLGLNHGQGFPVLAVSGQLQVGLNRHMGGTGRLARGAAGRVGVAHSGSVPVVFIPGVFAPDQPVRQRRMGVGHGGAVLFAQLLAQLHGAGGTGLHALAAGHAVLLRHLGGVGAAGEVRRVEQQGGPQGVADFYVAVADVEDLVCAVDVGDLMDKAVLFRQSQNLERPLLGDVVGAAGLHGVIGHVAELDAPVVDIVRAAVSGDRPGGAAGADTGGDMALVFFQPVGDVLQVHRLIFGFNGLFHGDDVHTDAVAARGNHLGDAREGDKRHALEEGGHRRILFDPVHGGVEQLRRAGHKEGKPVALDPGPVLQFTVVVVIVAIVVFENADPGHLLQQIAQPHRLVFRVHFEQLLKGVEFAEGHFVPDFAHFGGQDLPQAPVFGVVRGHAQNLVGRHIRDFSAQLQVSLVGIRLSLVLASHFVALFWHPCSSFMFCTAFRKYAAASSMFSPVFAEMGMIPARGFRQRMFSRHRSRLKLKYPTVSILLISTRPHFS